MNHDQKSERKINWILLAFLAIGGFFLFTEHRAHLLGFLPYLLLLACPLMHLFMHHGHHGHGRHEHDDDKARKLNAGNGHLTGKGDW